MDKKLLYLDTDISLGTPGAEIDDGAALIYLLRNPKIELLGAGAVFGNVPLRDAVLNLDRMLTWLGAENVPLGIGAEKPINDDMIWFEEWRAQYRPTLPWTPRPVTTQAADLMVNLVHQYPGQVSILGIGPMTNLALALRLDPEIASLAKEVVVMGGSFNAREPFAEFNVHCDPEAAQIVFDADWKVHVLGLDITGQIQFSRQDFACLRDGNPAIELLRTQAPGWIDRVEGMGWHQGGCGLHDAVAAAYLTDETIFKTEDTGIKVELQNAEDRGITRFSAPREDQPAVNAVTNVDVNKCRDLIWSYLQL
jgi:inosine-uridine nucleoside N-ribohydrolase